jgi:uncharacterized protein YlaI
MTAIIINNHYHVPLTTYMSLNSKHRITYNTFEIVNDCEYFFVCEVQPLLKYQNI